MKVLHFLAVAHGAHASGSHHCETFFDNMSIIAKASGSLDPRKVTGFSRKTCKKVYSNIHEKAPKAVHHVANLAAFLQAKDGAPISGNELVPVVRKLGTCPDDYDFGQSNVGPGSEAIDINKCQDIDTDICPHEPCVSDYLQTEVDANKTYGELKPGYGGGVLYGFFTDSLTLTSSYSGIWSGCDKDRTNAGPVAELVQEIISLTIAILITDVACKAVGDDIDFGFGAIVVDIPNGFRVACAIIQGIEKAVLLSLTNLKDQADFQDGLVDGAEIEAAYEHSKNLLTKQWQVFFPRAALY